MLDAVEVYEPLDPMSRCQLERALRIAFPHGPRKVGPDLASTRELVSATVAGLDHAFKQSGSPICVTLETKKPKSGPTVIVGLIIFTGDPTAADSTAVVPMTIAPSLVRLRERAIFLAHGEGAVSFLAAILAEISREARLAV